MARDFDGTNDRLVNTSAPITAYPFTMAGWFNADDATVSDIFVDIHDGTANNRWTMFTAGAAAGDPIGMNSVSVGVGTATNTVNGYTVGTWHHACMVGASATDRAIVLDGDDANKGTNTTSNTPVGVSAIRFGELGSGANDLDGRLAEWAIWNVALTADEISRLAKGINPYKVRPFNIVAYWQMFGRHSTEPDLVGGFHLTVTGATQAAHPPKAQGLWLPASRGVFVPAAGSLSIPVAMHSYRQRRIAA